MGTLSVFRFPGRDREESTGGNQSGKRGQSQQQEDINVSNPQQGSEWNNYQSRELGASPERSISEEEATEAFNDEE